MNGFKEKWEVPCMPLKACPILLLNIYVRQKTGPVCKWGRPKVI